MRLGRPLTRTFFERRSTDVARDLIGCVLVRRDASGQTLAGRLVELEAYLGDGSDPGSHAHRGQTPRNASMFGPPGRLYVYLSYGMHTCANLVTEGPGDAGAVLLRAVEPLMGIESMQRRRGLVARPLDRTLAGGPGRLGQAFGIELGHDGVSVLRGEWTIRARGPDDRPRVTTSPRIGLSKAADLPLRFTEAGSVWLSRPDQAS